MTKNVHVVPHRGKWAVSSEKAEKPAKVTDTQNDAINAAKEIAIKRGSEVVIHGKDGRIREKNSYGIDPFPPKG